MPRHVGIWLLIVFVAFIGGTAFGKLAPSGAEPPPRDASLFKQQRDRIHEAILTLREVCQEAKGDCDRERILDLTLKAAAVLTVSPENAQRHVVPVFEVAIE